MKKRIRKKFLNRAIAKIKNGEQLTKREEKVVIEYIKSTLKIFTEIIQNYINRWRDKYVI